jgi:hypothetical protein
MAQQSRIFMLNNTNSLVVKYFGTDPLRHGPTIFLWQKATPVIVGWFMGHMWKNNRKWYN